MSDQLFIRLSQDSDRVQWCVGGSGALPAHVSNIQQGTLDQALDSIQKSARGLAVVLVVPAADIVLSSVKLPIRQQSKLLQAVPYALEEHLAEDVEALHFAIGEKQADGSVPVASIGRGTLNNWLAVFKERGITVTAVLPETLCLPAVQATSGWQVLIDGRDCVVRNAPYGGFCCDISELNDFLSMALSDTELPEGLRIRVFRTPGSTLEGLDGLAVNHEVVEIKAALACLMPSNLANSINLLQGSLASEPAYERYWRPVRTTAILFLSWVLISTAYSGLQHYRLSSQVDQLETENIARFRQLFPQVTRVVDMRAQGEQQLSLLRQNGSGAGLFALLGATAQAVSDVAGLQVQEIQLRDGQLFMSLTANDIQSLENLRSHFKQQPQWTLDVQSANASTDGVQIRASLEAAL